MTVTDDGTAGSSRDHATVSSPTLATYSFRLDRTLNPLRVSRIDCRVSLRDRNLGAPILRPFRFPLIESNQFRYARRASWHACTSTTDATSPNHTRCGVFFASVTTNFCTSVSESFTPDSRDLPGSQAVVEHHPRTPERLSQPVLLAGRRIDAVPVTQLHHSNIPSTSRAVVDNDPTTIPHTRHAERAGDRSRCPYPAPCRALMR